MSWVSDKLAPQPKPQKSGRRYVMTTAGGRLSVFSENGLNRGLG
jgi:hypothetical protein